MKTIDIQSLRQLQKAQPDLLILDVRKKESYQKEHIAGAKNIPWQEITTQIESLAPDKSKPLVVYCTDLACQASPKAAKILGVMGYTNVYDYEEGIEGWKTAGLTTKSLK